MKKIIIIFDSNNETQEQVEEPVKGLPLEYEIEIQDISTGSSYSRKRAFSVLYNHGTANTPLYLFKEEDIYNSHYFEHGPLTKKTALLKLNN